MRTSEVKKKRYELSREEHEALRKAIEVLEQIENDEELAEVISWECCASADTEGTKEFLQTILNLNETDIDLC